MYEHFLKNEVSALEHRRPRQDTFINRIITRLHELLFINAILIIGAAILSAIFQFDVREISDHFMHLFYLFFYVIPVCALLPYTVFLHFKLLFKNLIYSANTITREKSPARWDTLALTNVTAKSVITGKWWACVIHLRKEYAFLALLRVASVIYIALIWTRLARKFFPPMPLTLRPNLYLEDPTIPFFSALFVFLLTLINLPMTASFGILGGLLNVRHGFLVSGIIRAVTLISLSAFFILLNVVMREGTNLYVFDAPFYTEMGILVNTFIITGESLLSNGVGVGIDIFTNRGYSSQTNLHAIYAGMILLILHALLMRTVLHIAKWLAKRQGLS